ncbi:MAG TPA: FAD-binding oxidoreductase [Chloroflexota bacterium]|nr:FAD-binding oxidoreductase [Chloroflexota bacterium]
MATLTRDQQTAVAEIVSPERASFDPRERRAYSHDTGVLPPLVRPFAGKTLADGVVQPECEAQLVALVRYAHRQGIPLTPRGKATSGYGGAVPAAGGLVVDLTRLTEIVDVRESEQTVTVRAGTVWKDLEATLSERGLALRLYPTSAPPPPSAAGWPRGAPASAATPTAGSRRTSSPPVSCMPTARPAPMRAAPSAPSPTPRALPASSPK